MTAQRYIKYVKYFFEKHMKRQDSILLLTGAVIRIRMKFPYRVTEAGEAERWSPGDYRDE